MEMKEIAKKNKKDLVALLKEKRDSLRNFRFSVSGSSVRNIKEGGLLRKDIARILTQLNKKD